MLDIIFKIVFLIMLVTTFVNVIIINKTNKNRTVVFPIIFCCSTYIVFLILNSPYKSNISVVSSIVFMLILSGVMFVISFAFIKEKYEHNKVTLSGVGIKIPKKLFLPLVIGLIIVSMVVFFPNLDLNIKDTNGENDFSLCEITLKDMIEVSVTPSQYMTSTAYDGEKSFVSGLYEDEDYDIVKYKAKSLSGTLVLNSTKINSDSFSISLKNTIVSGNCRIIVTIDGEYYDDFQLNDDYTMIFENIKNKEVLVIIAGESAECEIELSRQSGDDSVI